MTFLFAGLISFEDLVPFAIFGLFAAVAWWAMGFLGGGKNRAIERLDEFKNPALRRAPGEGARKKQDAMARVLEKATPALAKPLQPKTEAERGKIKNKLSSAGFRSPAATSIFLGLKFGGLLVGLFLGGGTLFGMSGMGQKTLIGTIAISAFFFYLPGIVLWFLGRRRREQIFLGLPDALDLMVVCVEAGLGLDQAMRKVAEEMIKSYPILALEFGMANFQLQMGKTRSEVLHDLGARTGVADLRSLASVLIQADKFGSSVARALRVQSDSMRTRRRQLAEERAAKTAVQLIFPLVLFIFPGIFVVLIGPAAITMVNNFFPLMSNGGGL